MRRLTPAVCLLTLLAAPIANAQVLFTENWDDGMGSTRWSTPITALEGPEFGFDGALDYNFDYSAIGAPSAPNSTGGSTSGVFMETNLTDNGVGEGEAIGILPLGFTLPDSDYKLTADVYLFWNGGSGSTEYATLGVHHQGTDNVPMRFNVNSGDGVAWQVDTDGDSFNDIFRYLNLEGAGAEEGLGGYEAIDDGTIPNVPTGSADPIGPFNQWVELSITRTGNEIAFAMNDYVIDTFNTEGFFTGGTLLIGQSDPFDSVNADDGNGNSNGVVFDNVVVEVVLPPVTGDYNGNGVVDAADYTIWRDTLGETNDLRADGNDNGAIESGDYSVWSNAFGDMAGAATAAPEPGTAILASIAVMLLAGRARQRADA